jgi:hypothetical protein
MTDSAIEILAVVTFTGAGVLISLYNQFWGWALVAVGVAVFGHVLVGTPPIIFAILYVRDLALDRIPELALASLYVGVMVNAFREKR